MATYLFTDDGMHFERRVQRRKWSQICKSRSERRANRRQHISSRPWLGHGRRRLVLVGVRDKREQAGLFGPIATFLLGLIERLIRRLDQIGWGAVPAGDRTGEARADGGAPTVGMRNAESLDSLPKRFRHLCRSVRTGAGKYDHKFVAAVPCDEVSWSVDGSRDSGGNLPQAFVARRMAEGIVVGFEPIDVEHDQRERGQFADGAAPLLV